MKSSTKSRLAAALIVGIALVLAVLSSRDDSPVVDEIPHIGSGYSYVKKLDMRLNPEHPPLVKDLAGLPLLGLGISDNVFTAQGWVTDVNGQWTFGRQLIYHSGADPDLIKTFARLPVLVFYLLTCWLVWKWARERFGDRSALLAVTLTAFSPTILAHGRLVTTDMASAAGVTAATYCFVQYLREHSIKNFIWAFLALGMALLAKYNTVLLAPYFVLIAVLWGFEGRIRSGKHWWEAVRLVFLTGLIGAAAFLLVVWPVYLVHTANYPIERQLSDTKSIVGWYSDNPIKSFAVWAADKPVIRGLGHWALGLAMVAQRNAGGNTIYYLGNVVKEGGPSYFPIVYFLKEPLAWWCLVSLAIAGIVFHRRLPRDKRPNTDPWRADAEEWIWLLWLAIYWFVSVRSTLNIGVRHLLPVYPFAILLVAGRVGVLLDWLHAHDRRKFIAFTAVVALLTGWYVFETVRVHPHYLTYFNQLAGGPSGGHRYVVDSNLDWGQDAKRLGQFVRRNGIPAICVDYFGWADAGWYLKDAYRWTSSSQWRDRTDFERRNECGGWLAVSGTFLQNSNGQKADPEEAAKPTYRWLLDEQPVAVVGNSIFVYRIE
jgi:4-amino-4-deoxy-L-arabinose transferase-like glycosyltransferase